ncbi:hypothetical protein HPB50_007407 [Hyalomma asiaticum]|uniref:Uncharacterized protein n=1 Tax=Hyalomma asiaticum TaxID=266040 RepID=A0ACB7RHA7_HYAAI|nr:hypothetical protein HPB50_007407 [Hyalomma asiaticum]
MRRTSQGRSSWKHPSKSVNHSTLEDLHKNTSFAETPHLLIVKVLSRYCAQILLEKLRLTQANGSSTPSAGTSGTSKQLSPFRKELCSGTDSVGRLSDQGGPWRGPGTLM